MQENTDEDREFTDEQMRAALRGVGEDARREAFAAGRPVFILKDSALVAVYSDGTEKIIERLVPGTHPDPKK
jgi:hypothetical protein